MNNNPWLNIEEPQANINFNAVLADKDNLLEFYWAKDSFGNLLFILHTQSKVIINQKIPALNGISISVGSIDFTNQLLLTLSSIADKDIFYTLCKDLLKSTHNLDNETLAIRSILKRLEKWQYFLKSSRKIIDKKHLKGLIGELYLIKKHLLKKYSSNEVLEFWKAPLQSVQDFEIDSMTIEVKTKSSVNSVTISSYEQLFTELNTLYLFVVTLTEATKNTAESFTIYDMVNDIKELIGLDDLSLIDKFNNLLMQYGFIELSEYEDFYFIITSDEFYTVTDDFPKVSEIPEGIEKLTYRINLDTCKSFLLKDKLFTIKGKEQ
ncbi:PD-(D/E)XK motif protein [Sulfurimonas sp. SAG-AH-194-C20]|nr:PD-(D/E)XK motif protein [Sulfurimonas sp. SAG-AH-194-C20]MDF1878856.1 PD-(D/E)XK motif protein [Sulfurimonas sp. SAG-AH-194-C20]